MTRTDTHCPYCALQCAMSLEPEGERVEVTARDFPTNRGGMCRKGWTSAEVLRAPDRLTTPLVRGSDGELHPMDWDDVLDLLADRLRSIAAEHGPDAVAVFGGGGLTNEKAYQLGKFARIALRTKHIDYNGRFCMASAAAAGGRVRKMPERLEAGVARRIAATDAGRAHPLLEGRPAAWDAPAIHGDEVVGAVELRTGEEQLCFVTSDAQLLRFQAAKVRPQGRGAGGMAGISLHEGARVIAGTGQRLGIGDRVGAVALQFAGGEFVEEARRREFHHAAPA